jgi:hypothetical protein
VYLRWRGIPSYSFNSLKPFPSSASILSSIHIEFISVFNNSHQSFLIIIRHVRRSHSCKCHSHPDCPLSIADSSQITGVSGYIGFRTLILALEAGFKVRAVIRKAEQAKKLESHKRVAPFVNNLQFCIIPDLSDTYSYDSHLQGVTGLLHIASPLANEVIIYVQTTRQKLTSSRRTTTRVI